ncbi:HNH endonuclease [Mangrovibrevibacter kandeliae]|uniref:HNH endonuclease n=1 Tax=Mangrovibrevibacter kandeliae TaxID=2968473 RepID=UPI0021177114|nr:HNH endonuclease [Aurantimonas sp. CSK15Z-1]
MPVTVPSFRRAKPQSLRPRAPKQARERFRGSARSRGYTTEWDRLRDDYIRERPSCEECLRRGFLRPAVVVDHMVPIRCDPARRLDASNLDSLCDDHHNGWKRRLEQFAEQTRQVEMLPIWIKQAETRPAGFQITRTGPINADGTFR